MTSSPIAEHARLEALLRAVESAADPDDARAACDRLEPGVLGDRRTRHASWILSPRDE